MKIYEDGQDLCVEVQNLRFTIKGAYTPPLVWIEQWRPKARDHWKILAQVNGDENLQIALHEFAKQLEFVRGMKEVKKSEANSVRKE